MSAPFLGPQAIEAHLQPLYAAAELAYLAGSIAGQ
jgi:hypothetical protein